MRQRNPNHPPPTHTLAWENLRRVKHTSNRTTGLLLAAPEARREARQREPGAAVFLAQAPARLLEAPRRAAERVVDGDHEVHAVGLGHELDVVPRRRAEAPHRGEPARRLGVDRAVLGAGLRANAR